MGVPPIFHQKLARHDSLTSKIQQTLPASPPPPPPPPRIAVRPLFLARDHHALTRPRKAAHALLHVHAQRERRKPREMPDALADVLVERNGIAKTGAARMRRGCEKTIVRRMSSTE